MLLPQAVKAELLVEPVSTAGEMVYSIIQFSLFVEDKPISPKLFIKYQDQPFSIGLFLWQSCYMLNLWSILL